MEKSLKQQSKSELRDFYTADNQGDQKNKGLWRTIFLSITRICA